MKVNLYYFSGTGNTLFITKKIRDRFIMNDEGHQVTIIPIQNISPSIEVADSSDIVGIIYPTYFFDAPDIVKEFAKNLRVRQNTYLFLYANSGGSLGNALYNMDQILGTDQVKARFEVVFPDNSIAFATKKEKIPTMLTDGEKTVEMHASQIYHQKVTHKSPKNLMLKTVEKAVIPFSKMFLGFGNMKLNSELCNGCGLCSQVCTMKNIKMTNSKDGWVPTFEKNCSMCFACLHFCPQEAIRLKSMSNKKENYQYHHPDISVKELIDAQL